MTLHLQIAKWGNSLAMRLPADLARRFHLQAGASVEVRIAADGALVIRPAGGSRHAFAAELDQERAALPMGQPVVAKLRREARY